MNITRREAIKRTAVIGIAGPVVLAATGCESKKQLVKWSVTGLQILDEVAPTLELMGAREIVALIDKAVPYAEKLKKALEDNDNTSAGQVLENLLGADGWLAKIADAVGVLKDEHRRNIVMGLLATAQISYRLIAAQIQNDAPATVASASKSAPKAAAAMKSAAAPNKLQLAFEATRF